MMLGYATVAAFLLFACVFIVAALTVGKFLRPNKPGGEKHATYECGEQPVGTAWFNFNPRFYIVALVFLVFDVEIALVYPVATVFRRWVNSGAGLFAFAELFVFVAILALGLVYVWKKGDLEWLREMRAPKDESKGQTP